MKKITEAMLNLRALLIEDGNSEAQADTKMSTLSEEIGRTAQSAMNGNYNGIKSCINSSSVLNASQKASFIEEIEA